MRLVLDTHTFLWHADVDTRMSSAATALLIDPGCGRRLLWHNPALVIFNVSCNHGIGPRSISADRNSARSPTRV